MKGPLVRFQSTPTNGIQEPEKHASNIMGTPALYVGLISLQNTGILARISFMSITWFRLLKSAKGILSIHSKIFALFAPTAMQCFTNQHL